MTDLEHKALETLQEVRDHFAVGHTPSRWTYMEVMGHVRDAIRLLENNILGCSTGIHACACTCKPPVKGVQKYHEKH